MDRKLGCLMLAGADGASLILTALNSSDWEGNKV